MAGVTTMWKDTVAFTLRRIRRRRRQGAEGREIRGNATAIRWKDREIFPSKLQNRGNASVVSERISSVSAIWSDAANASKSKLSFTRDRARSHCTFYTRRKTLCLPLAKGGRGGVKNVARSNRRGPPVRNRVDLIVIAHHQGRGGGEEGGNTNT